MHFGRRRRWHRHICVSSTASPSPPPPIVLMHFFIATFLRAANDARVLLLLLLPLVTGGVCISLSFASTLFAPVGHCAGEKKRSDELKMCVFSLSGRVAARDSTVHFHSFLAVSLLRATTLNSQTFSRTRTHARTHSRREHSVRSSVGLSMRAQRLWLVANEEGTVAHDKHKNSHSAHEAWPLTREEKQRNEIFERTRRNAHRQKCGQSHSQSHSVNSHTIRFVLSVFSVKFSQH